jgi:hypothetical protein
MMTALIVFGAAFPALDRESYAAPLNMGVALGLTVVSTVVHEAAHAAAALAVGMCVTAISIGRGPLVWTRRFAGAWLLLRAVPFTGEVHAGARDLSWIRWRLAAVAAAGPAVSALLTLVAWPFAAREDPARHIAPMCDLLIVNAFLVLTTALPFRRRIGGEEEQSDGWRLISIPFRSDGELSSFVNTYQLWDAERSLARGDVDRASVAVASALARESQSFAWRFLLATVRIERGQWREAARDLRQLLDEARRTHQAPATLASLSNNLAWAALWTEDPTLLEEADRLSAEAIAMAPRVPYFHGTRGAVLLARSELEDAERRLAYAFARNPRRSRALNACCLAMLHARRGRIAEAREWIAKARALDSNCNLLVRAEGALSADVLRSAAYRAS